MIQILITFALMACARSVYDITDAFLEGTRNLENHGFSEIMFRFSLGF